MFLGIFNIFASISPINVYNLVPRRTHTRGLWDAAGNIPEATSPEGNRSAYPGACYAYLRMSESINVKQKRAKTLTPVGYTAMYLGGIFSHAPNCPRGNFRFLIAPFSRCIAIYQQRRFRPMDAAPSRPCRNLAAQ